ncbi:hypothetical protein ACYCCF_24720 [Streptomyces argenteolus]|uniref:hypothetical protein n=1 Tax=Streptomyces sp. NPDC025273 TaxID=3155251 RepID=UPI00337F16DE
MASRAVGGRVLATVVGDALDRAVAPYLAGRREAAGGRVGPRRAIAVDGKVLRGSAHLAATHRRLLSAVTHYRAVTLAQAGAGLVMGFSRYSAKSLASVPRSSSARVRGVVGWRAWPMMPVGQLVRGMTGELAS